MTLQTPLPDGWTWTTLGDVCAPPQYGWTTSASAVDGLHLLRTSDITSGQIDWKTVPYCTEEPPVKEKYLLHDGDIVISRAGSVGFSLLIKNPKPAVFASYLIRFRPLINEKFVSFFLQSPYYWQAISENSLGIAIPNVNATKLKQITIPLPPLPEQERIVAKIEELFTQLDAGTAALRRIQAGLKRYKASLLKAACEGRLVEQDPNDEPAEELLRRLGKKPLKDPDLPELPRGWCWVNWDQLVSLSQNGFGKRNSEKGTPTIVLRLADIEDNKTNLAKSRRIKASLEEVEKYRLQNNDILCIRVNGSLENVGRMIIIRDYDESILFCDHFIRFRLVLPELSPFITFYFQADRARKYVELNRVSSAGQNTISQSTLFNFSVPLPPLEEQHRIVNEIERLLSVEAKIEEVVKANIERSSRLRQAILKRAFEGRLV